MSFGDEVTNCHFEQLVKIPLGEEIHSASSNTGKQILFHILECRLIVSFHTEV